MPKRGIQILLGLFLILLIGCALSYYWYKASISRFTRTDFCWASVYAGDKGDLSVIVKTERGREKSIYTHFSWRQEQAVEEVRFAILRWDIRSLDRPGVLSHFTPPIDASNRPRPRIGGWNSSTMITHYSLLTGMPEAHRWDLGDSSPPGSEKYALQEVWAFSRNGRFLLGKKGNTPVILDLSQGSELCGDSTLEDVFKNYSYLSSSAYISHDGRHVSRLRAERGGRVAAVAHVGHPRVTEYFFWGEHEQIVEILDCEWVDEQMVFLRNRLTHGIPHDKNCYEVVTSSVQVLDALPSDLTLTRFNYHWAPSKRLLVLVTEPVSGTPRLVLLDYGDSTRRELLPALPVTHSTN